MTDPILIAKSRKQPIWLLPKMANRHGLIAGATGTGKTVTLQTLSENFSERGVPVFMADVKGDLAGMSQPGAHNPTIPQSYNGQRNWASPIFPAQLIRLSSGIFSAKAVIRSGRRSPRWARSCSVAYFN